MTFARTSWPKHVAWLAVAAALVAAALLVARAPRAHAIDAPSTLSADELSRLERGELVVREASERRGKLRLIGGTAFQVVQAKPEIVWRALLDTQYYPRMLPELHTARVVREHGPQRTVFMQHGSPAAASYHLTMQIDAARRDIAFRMDESRAHDIRAAWGFYTVRPHTSGRTLLVFGVLTDPGDGLIKSMLRPAVQEWALRVPWMVKRFVEGSGRYIYKK
jgi:hypothetical protein